MMELTRILLTIVAIAVFIQLGFSIALNWDEKSKENKKLDRIAEIFSIITISTIGLSVLVWLLTLLWKD